MNTSEPPTNWQRIGYESSMLERVAENIEITRPSWWVEVPPPPKEIWWWTMDWVRSGMAVFALGSMGFPISSEPLSDLRRVGRQLVAAALYYFFGAWRNELPQPGVEFDDELLDREQARAKLEWTKPYRAGLTVAASLSDWESVDRLLQWPAADLPVDEGTDERTRQDNLYQIWLASRLRNDPGASVNALHAMVKAGHPRRPRMLLAAADALFAGDAAGLSETLDTYLRYYRASEWRSNRPDFGVCLDATALWHLARRRGLGEILLPEASAVFIAKPWD
jgi:hypothetical protein